MQRPPHNPYAPQRSLYLDEALERSYARRRVVTVTVLLALLLGGAYAIWGRGGPGNPADIPTIKADGAYRQKPTEPGGIDIPHQDVQVYDALENKAAPAQVEHLLPMPEIPKDVPRVASVPVSPKVDAAVTTVPKTDILLTSPPPTSVTTTAGLEPAAPEPPAPVAPAPAPVAEKAIATTVVTKTPPPEPAPSQNMTIEQVIKETQNLPPASPPEPSAPAPQVTALSPPASVAPATASITAGSTAVQLASVPDEDKAQSMMRSLQKKYATQLGGATLRLTRADLGARGVYYRIQSQGLSEDQAAHICAALKQVNAGCILVRK